MKFGLSAKEAEAQPPRGAGGAFMKYPKAGDNTVRILDEPDKWIYYWEHFNPNGFSFPCTNERDTCKGCTSDDPKMQKASQKVAFNAYDGQYTNVWKVPKLSVADKLKSRYERYGTITDRDYLIRQIKTSNSTDYDVEGLDKEPLTKDMVTEFEQHRADPETMLAQAYEEAWGDSPRVQQAKSEPRKAVAPPAKANGDVRAPFIVQAAPEPEQKTYNEAELRTMEPWDLATICHDEGLGDIPSGTDTSDEIVDWMLKQS